MSDHNRLGTKFVDPIHQRPQIRHLQVLIERIMAAEVFVENKHAWILRVAVEIVADAARLRACRSHLRKENAQQFLSFLWFGYNGSDDGATWALHGFISVPFFVLIDTMSPRAANSLHKPWQNKAFIE